MQFYFDPVSKNVFRSLKAVNRHLKTEELGTLTQNSEGNIHKDSEDDCTFVSVLKLADKPPIQFTYATRAKHVR